VQKCGKERDGAGRLVVIKMIPPGGKLVCLGLLGHLKMTFIFQLSAYLPALWSYGWTLTNGVEVERSAPRLQMKLVEHSRVAAGCHERSM